MKRARTIGPPLAAACPRRLAHVHVEKSNPYDSGHLGGPLLGASSDFSWAKAPQRTRRRHGADTLIPVGGELRRRRRLFQLVACVSSHGCSCAPVAHQSTSDSSVFERHLAGWARVSRPKKKPRNSGPFGSNMPVGAAGIEPATPRV